MSEIPSVAAFPFCFHEAIRHPRRRLGARSSWGPQFASRDCPDCGATVEVRV